MTTTDTLKKAAALLDNYYDVTVYPGIRVEVMNTRAALRAMAARITTDNSDTLTNALARIAELEPLQEVAAQLEDEKRVLRKRVELLLAVGEMLAAVTQGAKEDFVRVPYGASHEDVSEINEWHGMAAEAMAKWEALKENGNEK